MSGTEQLFVQKKNSLNLGSIWIHKNGSIAHTNKDRVWNSILGTSQTWAANRSKSRRPNKNWIWGWIHWDTHWDVFVPVVSEAFYKSSNKKWCSAISTSGRGSIPWKQLQILLFSCPWRPTLFVSKGRIGQDNDLKAFCRRVAVGAVLVAFVQSNPCKRVWWWGLLTNHIQNPMVFTLPCYIHWIPMLSGGTLFIGSC